ncbi:MAG: hypothetical protein A2284_06880 [Deltaproteobacteria bacterium RIFOXYA12_FULL_61_11]|nr:MAG: hypothetical protein A2284_06880 [Deltaproteobacteria bacterium RIFOXYA12_FULL_61_11]
MEADCLPLYTMDARHTESVQFFDRTFRIRHDSCAEDLRPIVEQLQAKIATTREEHGTKSDLHILLEASCALIAEYQRREHYYRSLLASVKGRLISLRELADEALRLDAATR